MSLFRTLSAHHFTIYQSVLAFIAVASVLHILLSFAWLNAAGYAFIMVGGFWAGQGMVNLVNYALGYRKNSQTDSLD